MTVRSPAHHCCWLATAAPQCRLCCGMLCQVVRIRPCSTRQLVMLAAQCDYYLSVQGVCVWGGAGPFIVFPCVSDSLVMPVGHVGCAVPIPHLIWRFMKALCCGVLVWA